MQEQVNFASGAARNAQAAAQKLAAENQALRQGLATQLSELHAFKTNLAAMQGVLSQLQQTRTGGDPQIQRIENIPGRRVPFDLSVDIGWPSGQAGTLPGSVTIDQDGPFIAVKRWVAILSFLQFTTPGDNGSTLRFQGRSFGRWRAPHSVNDFLDSQGAFANYTTPPTFPGTGQPAWTSPVSNSGFRTMQPDFRIRFLNQGSSFPRQNNPVPSCIYVEENNNPSMLGALDFFERGEQLTWEIQPTHPNNPEFGNIFGSFVTRTTPQNVPSLAGQFDTHEGISLFQASPGQTPSDPITRVTDAIIVIGMSGYKIIQQPGAGPY